MLKHVLPEPQERTRGYSHHDALIHIHAYYARKIYAAHQNEYAYKPRKVRILLPYKRYYIIVDYRRKEVCSRNVCRGADDYADNDEHHPHLVFADVFEYPCYSCAGILRAPELAAAPAYLACRFVLCHITHPPSAVKYRPRGISRSFR